MSSKDNYKLWGGCFDNEPSEELRRLNNSLPIDIRLYHEDIKGSKAWAEELHISGHLSMDDNNAIQDGLAKVEIDIEKELNHFGKLKDIDEDIHSVVERRLGIYAGDAAMRLHTARSRNDQSTTDTRLWMMSAVPKIVNVICEIISVLNSRAENEINIIVSGYTHLQRAQPIRWSHFLLSHIWFLKDDCARFKEMNNRISVCPLGSGALAGCCLDIDRCRLAHSLGFTSVTQNSMFAVSSRDHIVEFLNTASLCGIHLSRLSEDLIIYSSQEFGIVTLSDLFSTGSSLMPQKRNPDGLELVRGAAGLLMADSFAMSSILKSLPSTYNKDMQNDKEILFRSYDKLMDCLKVLKGTVETMKVDKDRALHSLDANMIATDIAHALVRLDVPFRRAHHLVGGLLKMCRTLGTDISKLTKEEYCKFSSEFEKVDINTIFSWEKSVDQYTSTGGTAMNSVVKQIEIINEWLKSNMENTC